MTILAAIVGLLAFGCVTELASRWWIRKRRRYYVWTPGSRVLFHPDPAVVPEFEPVMLVAINAEGERGGDVPRPDKDVFRVLAVGGSAVEGLSLDQKSNWPALLEQQLSEPENLQHLRAGRVHVGTVGRSAISAHDLDLILERILPRYPRLDALLIMIGAGDVVKWLAEGGPADRPAPSVPVSSLFACHPEGPFGWRPSRLATVELLKRGRQRWLRPLEVRWNAGRWIGEARAMRAAAKEIRTRVNDPTVMLDGFASHLDSALRRSTAHAGRVLVLRTPWFEKDYTAAETARLWHGGMGHPWARRRIDVYFAFDVVNQLMACMDARTVQVAQQRGVEHVDLNAAISPGLDNYYDYTHFTPPGARIVAGCVAHALRCPVEPAESSHGSIHSTRTKMAGSR
jgi:lysophospholipase L1-like esterase